MTAETVRLRIEGMGCDGCVGAVDEALRKVPGVRQVTIDLAEGRAEVEVQAPANTEPLLAAVERAGYDAAIA